MSQTTGNIKYHLIDMLYRTMRLQENNDQMFALADIRFPSLWKLPKRSIRLEYSLTCVEGK